MADITRAQDQLFDRRTSAREKYAALVVGRPGLAALIKHELITLASQSMPGALGLLLRQILYPTLLGACGRNVVFGQNVVLRHPHKIRIGNDVLIDDNCLIDAKGESNRGITIGNGVFIGRNTILSCKNGDIDLEDRANIGSIRRFSPQLCILAAIRSLRLVTTSSAISFSGRRGRFSHKPGARPLSRLLGAWPAPARKLLDGVSIGDGAVVGAGAVVRRPCRHGRSPSACLHGSSGSGTSCRVPCWQTQSDRR
jgi:acetyltransferase-like isoleucine patch superfamily enzyme